jgi:hypothetical protein
MELEKLRHDREALTCYQDRYNNLWGELDWITELHRILYDYTSETTK